MNNNDVKQIIYGAIRNRDRYQNEITEDTNLIEDLGFSSIDMIELIYFLEEKCNIQFSFEDLDIEILMIVGKLVELVLSKTTKQ